MRSVAILALATLPVVFAAVEGAGAAGGPARIAVFAFELRDGSAAGGIIPADDNDRLYLAQSTAEAKRLLAESGRYDVVETGGVSAPPLASCGGCEGPLARTLGADQAMIGLITRINRTEYTIQVRVTDAISGETIANSFTGLRMGANYAWSRGVRSLVTNEILPPPPPPASP